MERLIKILIDLSIYAVIWMIIYEIFYRFSPYPSEILKIEDKNKQKLKFYSYLSFLPALLHAPITTLVSIAALCSYGIRFNQETARLESFPLYYSASFFIFDGFNGIIRKYNDNLVLAHHVMIVVVIIWSLWVGKYGSELCNGIVQGEITNPLYAIYDILGFWGVAESKTRPLGISFMLSFIFIRAFISPILMRAVFKTDVDIFFKLSYSTMWIISMMLIWMMINKTSKQLAEVLYCSNDRHSRTWRSLRGFTS